MKKFDKRMIVYVLVGIGLLVIQNLTTKFLQNYSQLINLIVWGIIFSILQFKNTEFTRYQNVKDKIIYTLLIMVGYYVVYFALGFFYGYSNNPYSQEINAVMKNILFIIGLSLLQEYTRYKVLYDTKEMISYVIITLLFAMFSLDFTNFSYYFSNPERTLEYIFGDLVVSLIHSALLTFFTLKGGIKLTFSYTIISKLGIIFMPILPKINWFIKCVLELVIDLLLFIVIHYLNQYRNRNIERIEIVKSNPIKTIPVIIFLTIFTLFVAGILPYKPVAVMSNSMVPVFSRGDIIIIKKIDEKQIKNLEEGQIVEYKVASGSSIVHRIKKISQSENGLMFTTKGDNNISEDSDKVQENQIKGIVTMVIPYLGFPSVYFSQFVMNMAPKIDT